MADFPDYEPWRLEIDILRFGCDDFKPHLEPLRRGGPVGRPEDGRRFPDTET
jgi:hypothetical protein